MEPTELRNDVRVIEIARKCHDANRAFCEAIGDTSQVPWESAPGWQIESAVTGVIHAMDPSVGPGESHRSWLKEKAATGWTWGPVKDADRKEHPCIVPFDDLPPEQQAKDYIFLAVARCGLRAIALWPE